MTCFNGILKDSSPVELRGLITACTNNEDLAKRLEENPKQLFSFIQNINTVGNQEQAQWLSTLLNKLTLEELESPEIKRVGRVLRNCGGFNQNAAPDFELQQQGEAPIKAHKSILMLESPYFRKMASFEEFQKGKLVINNTKITPEQINFSITSECLKIAVEYMYAPEEGRKKLIGALNKALLPDMARLADLWSLEELKGQCDEELCNSIGEFTLDKDDLESWQFTPKFSLLLRFIAKEAADGDLNSLIEQMLTSDGASKLASKCTPEETLAFATLKLEFGKACLPPGTFGTAEWEKAFPITINEVPPLPPNIHAILEQDDPCEPGKKLKETCLLFLRPKTVTFHEGGVDKELLLSFDGVEQLAKNAIDSARRTHYSTFEQIRAQLNSMQVAEAAWVLMRKEVIPGTREESFEIQQTKLTDSFEVPKVIDAVLLNILTFVSEGRYLYGQEPWTYTRCQEKYGDRQIVVGGFGPSGLFVFYNFDGGNFGLSGAWKFF